MKCNLLKPAPIRYLGQLIDIDLCRGSEFIINQRREVLECLRLAFRKAPRLFVDQAQSSDTPTVRRVNWIACVETHGWIACNEWIVGKALVGVSILNDKSPLLQNRVATKRYFSRCLTSIESLLRLEPLPIRIDEAYQTYIDIEQAFRHPGYSIKALFGR
jgi:hypothetical protein